MWTKIKDKIKYMFQQGWPPQLISAIAIIVGAAGLYSQSLGITLAFAYLLVKGIWDFVKDEAKERAKLEIQTAAAIPAAKAELPASVVNAAIANSPIVTKKATKSAIIKKK